MGEPNQELPVRRVTPTAPSYLNSDSDTDSDSDAEDGSLLLKNDWIVGVSESLTPVVDINQFVGMAVVGQAQPQPTAEDNHQPHKLQNSHRRTAGWHR